MINSLFVIWSLETGGAERFLVGLLKNIDRKKIRPTVCCLNWKGQWAGELEEKDIEVIALNKKDKMDLAAFIKLFRIIRKGNYQLVNTHLWAADVMGRLAAMLAGTPVIISTAQNVDIWKKWHHRLADRVLSCGTCSLIAVSEAVARYYDGIVGIPREKITVIHNAIETARFSSPRDTGYLYAELGLSPQDTVFACVGRLSEQKGQKYLLEALNMLKPGYPGMRVIFTGDGDDRNALQDTASRLGIRDMVRFAGNRRDIPQILAISRALVLPSIYEGLPLCVIEAMAASKPVIATDVGGTGQLVKNGETGFLVKPADPGMLAEAVEKLMKMPDKGEGMGRKGAENAMRHYSIEAAARQTEDLFLSLCGKKCRIS